MMLAPSNRKYACSSVMMQRRMAAARAMCKDKTLGYCSSIVDLSLRGYFEASSRGDLDKGGAGKGPVTLVRVTSSNSNEGTT